VRSVESAPASPDTPPADPLPAAGWFLTLAAAAFWIGVLGAERIPASVSRATVLAAVGLACLVVPVVQRRRRQGGHAGAAGRVLVASVLLGGFALLGAADGALRAAHIEASPLSILSGRSVQIHGSLGADPEPGALGWTVAVNVEVLWPTTEGWPEQVAVHDPVWTEGRGRPPPLHAGDRVEVAGLLDQPSGDFGTYLRHRGYAAALSASTFRYLGPPSSPVVRAAEAVRRAFRGSLQRVFPPREAGLMMGLTLGDTSRLDPGVEEDFKATGLTHLLAVSGENLAMFLAPVLGFALWLGAGRRGRFVIGLSGVVFFGLLTRAEPSVLRASAMAVLTMLGIFLGRPRTVGAIMGGSVLALLAINPTLVYSVGFQLSVAATAGMALLANPIADRLRFLPRGLALAAGTTVAAQIGVTPVLLYYFGWVPTVTLMANVLAYPTVGPGMLLGLAAAAVGLVSTIGGTLIARLALFPLGYLEGVAHRLARAPLPSITGTTGRSVSLLAGLALVIVLGWWFARPRRLHRRAALALTLLVPIIVWTRAFAAGAPPTLTVTFFDVGQGDAALIESPGGAHILIDGGPDPDVVATKLAALGVHRLDLVVATHPHADHVAGLPVVLARIPVALVVDPGCAGTSPFYAAFLRAVAANGAPFRHPRVGAELHVADVTMEVLGPERCWRDTDSDPNNDSLVLLVRDGDSSVLFTGDAERENQTDLLRDERPLLTATVLKVPHHGGNTSLATFFAAVHASVAVVSVGQPNRYGHPNPGVLARLRADGMRVFRTDRLGDVVVTFHGRTVQIRSTHHG
jgi:competence protein ComEC